MYQALYRKYRSKTFDDVSGQEAITTTLKNEVVQGKTSHAYLFTGLRGSGKTTCSKLLAKAVNCLSPVDGNPCCQCEICRGIDNDSITDVMEIDAASNSGVDYMRELREQAFYTPVRCQKRVYIIDETHMLSAEAFNALLKIMEEPPPHVMFILATTEAHKVPATIISRCQRFDFGRIPSEAIASRLSFIAQQENLSITHEAGLMIARLSAGSMRDAISLLDQCFSHSPAITADTVVTCGGLQTFEGLFSLSQAVAKRDTTASLLALQELFSKSNDLVRLTEQLIAHFRNLLLAACTDQLEDLIICPPEELIRLKEGAKAYSVAQLLGAISEFQEAFAAMGRAGDRRVLLESAAVRLTFSSGTQVSASDAGSIADPALMARLERLERQLETLRTLPRAAGASAPAVNTAPPKPPAKNDVPSAATLKSAAPFPQWDAILELLSQKNKALSGALAGSRAYITGDLVLVDSSNALFLKLIRENEYAKQNLRDCILTVTGNSCRLGPYKAELYAAEKQSDPLDEILRTADQLGVPVSVSGEQ